MNSSVRLWLPEEAAEGRSFEELVERYLADKRLAAATRAEYQTLLNKWSAWSDSGLVPEADPIRHRSGTPKAISNLTAEHLADFVRWVEEHPTAKRGRRTNPGRLANKAGEQLRALLRYAWSIEWINAVPRMPARREQRSVHGRYWFTADEIDRIYRATGMLTEPRGRVWRAAIVLLFNYGWDTAWLFGGRSLRLSWAHVRADPQSPANRSLTCEHGWIRHHREKTGAKQWLPMNQAARRHVDTFARREDDQPVLPDLRRTYRSGRNRPNDTFRRLLERAEIPAKTDEDGVELSWTLRDLRKTCATAHEANIPGSSSVILGHAPDGGGLSRVTAAHYADRSPLAMRAILTLPQPPAFLGS